MKHKNLWEIVLFLTVSLPIGNSAFPYFDFLYVFYEITLLDICFFILGIISIFRFLKNASIRISKWFYYCNIIIILILCVYLLKKGLSNYGNSALRDGFRHFRCVLFLLIALDNKMVDANIIKILGIIRKGLYVYTVLFAIAFFLLKGNVLSGGNNTLWIVLLPAVMYQYIVTKEKTKRELIVDAIFYLVGNSISQDRTTLIASIMGTMIVLVYSGIKTRKISTFKRTISVVLIVIISGIIILFNNASLIERFSSVGNSTILARIYTGQYYLNAYIKNGAGTGFGAKMHMLTPGKYVLSHETFQIDNALIVILYKGGYLYLISNLILIICPIIRSKGLQGIYRIVVTGYALLLVSASIMTSQLFTNVSVSLFIWSIVGLSLRKNRKMDINDEKVCSADI